MDTEEFEITTHFPVPPERLFDAWLDSQNHSDMTGALAEVSAMSGDRFSAWDGYISGTNLTLDRPRRIEQSWRTTEFPVGSPDSLLELLFEPEGDGTRITLFHREIPSGQGEDYRSGWWEFYFNPMKDYFERMS